MKDTPLRIAHLQGSIGSSAQIGRTSGLDAGIGAHDNWSLVFRESGDFTQAKGQEMTEKLSRLEQVVTQLGKLIDVIKIVNLTKLPSIARELVLIKIKAGKESRADIKNIVEIFRAKIVDISPENVVVELTGQQSKIDGFIDMFADYEIIEIARTGAIALSRGPVPVKEM